MRRVLSNTPCHGFGSHLENLQCLYENLMSNNFYKMAVLKKMLLYLHLYRFYCKNLRVLHAAACLF